MTQVQALLFSEAIAILDSVQMQILRTNRAAMKFHDKPCLQTENDLKFELKQLQNMKEGNS